MAQEKGGWYNAFRNAFNSLTTAANKEKERGPVSHQDILDIINNMGDMKQKGDRLMMELSPYKADSEKYYDAKNIDDVDFAKTFTIFSKEPGGDGFSQDMAHNISVGFKDGKIASVVDYRKGDNGEEQEWEVYGKDKLASYFEKFFPQYMVHYVANGNQSSPYTAYGGYRGYNPGRGLYVPSDPNDSYSQKKVSENFLPSAVFKPYNSWSQIFHDAFSEMDRRNEASKDIGSDAIKGMGR